MGLLKMNFLALSRSRGVLFQAGYRLFCPVDPTRTCHFGRTSLLSSRWRLSAASLTYSTTSDGLGGIMKKETPRHEMVDFTKTKFQEINHDLQKVEHFRSALQERLKTTDNGAERDKLQQLLGVVVDQLERLRKVGIGSVKVKMQRNYEPSDFNLKIYDDIKHDLEELEQFWSALQKHLKSLHTKSEDLIRLIRLDAVIQNRIEELRKTSGGEKQLEFKKAKAFVEKLMGTKIETIDEGSGMRVLRDIPDLETENKIYDLILRTVTQPFWQACIDTVDNPECRDRVCAIGSPGIGKTYTTPFLIRMLLERGKTVVYHFQTPLQTGWLYEFSPTLNAANEYDIKVTIYSSLDFVNRNIASLRSPETYYIVDPGKVDFSCDPQSSFQPKVIIVASPDSRHWGGEEFRKSRGNTTGYFKYYPLWDDNELVLASPYMAGLSEGVILDRYRTVGGVPRRIFASESNFIQFANVEIPKSVALLTEDQVEMIVREEYVDLDTKLSSQPRSYIMGYKSTGPSFSERTVKILSPAVAEKVYSKHMKKLWKTMVHLGARGGAGTAFEAYMRHVMYVGDVTFSLQAISFSGKENLFGNQTSKHFDKCENIRVVSDPVQASIEVGETLFHSTKSNFPLIDFIYRDAEKKHFHAFQATMAGNHDASAERIRDLERKVGGAKLSLYYLVPEPNFTKFKVKLSEKDPGRIECSVYKVLVPDPNDENTGSIFVKFMRNFMKKLYQQQSE